MARLVNGNALVGLLRLAAVLATAVLFVNDALSAAPARDDDDDFVAIARPAVALTSPAANGVFAAPATISLAATATTRVGTIRNVGFWQDSTLLNTTTVRPFTYTWANVPAGVYALRARATSSMGLTADSAPVTVRVCGNPTVSVTAPVSGAQVLTATSVTVQASAASPANACAITKVEFYQQTTGAPALIGTALGAAPYQINWVATPAGLYTLTAKVYDERGVTATSSPITFIVGQPPSVSITAPAANAVIPPGTSIPINANASDADGTVAKVEFYNNGTTLLGTSTTSPYSFTWPTVAKGNYSLTAKAYDNLGITATSAAVPIIVTTPPTVSITAPAHSAVLTAGSSTTIQANAADPDGTIAKVEFYRDATLLCTITAAPFDCAWNAAAGGVYSLTAKAYDNQGATTTSGEVTVFVNQLPTVAITSPTNGASFGGTVNLTINVNAADSDGTVSKVELLDGSTLLTTLTAAPYTYAWTSVPIGSHSLTAKATDNRGAATTSTIVQFSVNALPPDVRMASPTSGQLFPASGTITVSATASSPNPGGTITKVEFYIYGSSQPLNTDEVAPFTFNWTQVTAGTYTLVAKAYDERGLVSTSAGITVPVCGPPEILLTSPAANTVLAAPATFNITASAASDCGIQRVEFSHDGTLINKDSAAPYASVWSDVPVGNHSIKALAVDGLNQTSQALVPVQVIANSPPEPTTISAPVNGASVPPGARSIVLVASDRDSNLATVDLSVDGVLAQRFTGGGVLSTSYDFTTPGIHVITAVATDSAGATSTSSALLTVLDSVAITPPAFAQLAGSSDGAASVSPMGAATYTMPLAVAPGIAGLVPALSLNYSSQGREGLLGYGWSLGGLSMITRCPPTLAQDAIAGAVTFKTGAEGSDRFCLDGKRLVIVGDNNSLYGENGSEYRTEVDEFSRVVSYKYSDPNIWRGVHYFKVWTKSGLLLYYGWDGFYNTNFSAVARRYGSYTGDTAVAWALFRVEDRHGNAMTFDYAKDTSGSNDTSLRPISIAYGPGGTSRVVFEYEDGVRPDPYRGYQGGAKLDNDKRLSKITSYANTFTVVRQHRVSYTQNAVTGRSLVSQITECDAEGGGQCLPATNFSWTTRSDTAWSATNFFGPPVTLRDIDTVRDLSGKIAVADFNGDGKADIAVSMGAGWNVCISTGSQFSCSTDTGLPAEAKSQDALLGDFNGDGRSDIAIPKFDLADRAHHFADTWTFCIANKVAYGASPTFACSTQTTQTDPTLATSVFAGASHYAVADVNGDGRDDILIDAPAKRCLSSDTGSIALCGAYPNADMALGDFASGFDASGYRQPTFAGDYNGDARTDILSVDMSPAYSSVPLTSYLAEDTKFSATGTNAALGSRADIENTWESGGNSIGDVNGDGLSDIVLRFRDTAGTTAKTHVCRSMGTGFFDCRVFDQSPDPTRTLEIASVGDFDGDGRADVLAGPATTGGTSRYRLCQVTGDAYLCQPWTMPALSTRDVGPLYGDFDGDGRIDLAVYSKDTQQWTVYRPSKQTADLLQAVSDGHGRWTTFSYAPISDPGVYTPEANPSSTLWPLRDMNSGTTVVQVLATDDGIGGSSDTVYTYSALKTSVDGRGLAGFRTVTATDVARRLTTTTTYQQEFPFTGMVNSAETVSNATGRVVRKIVNSDPQQPQTATAKSKFPFFTTSTETTNDLNGGARVTTTRVWDYGAAPVLYGNPSSLGETFLADGVTFTATSTFGYWPAATTGNTWSIDRVRRLSVLKSGPGGAETRTTDFTYDSTYYDLATIVIEPEDNTTDQAYKLTTALTRDATTGNVTKRNLQWRDPSNGTNASRDVEVTSYADSAGRYPTTLTNAKSQNESRRYDDRTGALSLRTGVDNVTTTWQYDGFGRRIRETRADGTYTTWDYKACNTFVDPDCAGAVSAVVEQTFGSSGARIVVPRLTYFDRLRRPVLSKTWGFDGAPIVAEKAYDARGFLRSAARPHKTSGEARVDTTYGYNDLGETTSVRYPTDAGFTTDTITYSRNKKSAANTAMGTNRDETYNAIGKLANVTETTVAPNTTKVDYQYDGFGNLTRTTDQVGNIVSITYDRLGRKTVLDDPDLGHWQYNVNALGLTWKQTDAKSQVSRLTYDELDRLSVRDEGGVTARWNYDTTLTGHLGSATTPTYSRTYGYDGVGRLTSLATSITDATYGNKAFASAYQYDEYGRLQLATHQHGSFAALTLVFGYNARGEQSQIRSTDTIYWVANSKDGVGHVTNETLGNALSTSRSYYLNSARLQTLQTGSASAPSAVQSDTYSYDVLGRLSKRDSRVGTAPVVSESFGYDALGRLTSSQVLGVTAKTYVYDDLGNFTAKTGVGSGLAGSWRYKEVSTCNPTSARPNAVTSIDGVGTFCYDANGNLTSGNGLTLEWTAFNQPLSIKKDASHTEEFAYGPERQRVTHHQVNGATDQTFFYAGPMELAAGAGGTVLRTYLPRQVGVVVDAGGGSRTVRYFHRDHLGSTEAITDANGAYVEGFAYDSWGKRRNLDGSDAGGITALNDHYGYTGQEMMDGTGLVHMNGRVYDPVLGRFQAPDPYVDRSNDTQGMNRFAYVQSRPLDATDPSGYQIKIDVTAPQPQTPPDATIEVVGHCNGECPLPPAPATMFSNAVRGVPANQRPWVGGTGGSRSYLSIPGKACVGSPSVMCRSAPSWADRASGRVEAWYGLEEAYFGYRFFGAVGDAVGAASAWVRNVLTSDVAAQEGVQLYRVFGDEARGLGQYYTTVNPGTVSNYREAAGLFPGNSGSFLLEGRLIDAEGAIFAPAAKGPGGVGGGLPEVFVPRPASQVIVDRVSGVNPPF